jgi:hypothetical protein
MVNIRSTLQKEWSTYDIDSMYSQYVSTGEKPYRDDPEKRDIFLRYAHSQISLHTTQQFLDIPIQPGIRSLTLAEFSPY